MLRILKDAISLLKAKRGYVILFEDDKSNLVVSHTAEPQAVLQFIAQFITLAEKMPEYNRRRQSPEPMQSAQPEVNS